MPEVQAVIVLGAYVYPNGQVSWILKDRLDTALAILQQHKNAKVLVSGDHSRTNYDEVNAMRKYLEENGVATENIFMDHAGFSTYESMYRARDIFTVKSAVIVTQGFHLQRAVYLARAMGIQAYGIASDHRQYSPWYQLRESIARSKDFLMAAILKPKPTFLGEQIPIDSSDGSVTHDQ